MLLTQSKSRQNNKSMLNKFNWMFNDMNVSATWLRVPSNSHHKLKTGVDQSFLALLLAMKKGVVWIVLRLEINEIHDHFNAWNSFGVAGKSVYKGKLIRLGRHATVNFRLSCWKKGRDGKRSKIEHRQRRQSTNGIFLPENVNRKMQFYIKKYNFVFQKF